MTELDGEAIVIAMRAAGLDPLADEDQRLFLEQLKAQPGDGIAMAAKRAAAVKSGEGLPANVLLDRAWTAAQAKAATPIQAPKAKTRAQQSGVEALEEYMSAWKTNQNGGKPK